MGGLVAVVVVYLVVLQLGGLVLRQVLDVDAGYAEFPDAEALLAAVVLPVGASLVFVIGILSVLRWWPRVLRDPYPVARWVWIVPIGMLVVALVVIDYGHLADIDGGLVVLAVVGSLMVGCAEELMFRGVAVTTLRDTGMRETRVALWSSLLFGAVHITNIVTEGPGAIFQVLIVSVSGFFFYLAMRVSRTILVPMALHALWDFSVFSAAIGPDGGVNPLVGLSFAFNVVLGLVLLVRRHHIGVAVPGQDPTPGSAVPA